MLWRTRAAGRRTGGRAAELDHYVTEKLVPLWTKFPKAVRVEILRGVEAEDSSHRYPMVLEITYTSCVYFEQALASPVRAESREVTRGLAEFFDGRIFHVVYGLAAHEPAAAA